MIHVLWKDSENFHLSLQIKPHPYIKEHPDCRPIMIQALKFLYDLSDSDTQFNVPMLRPRVPNEILFVIGGWSEGSARATIETYDTRADKWIKLDKEYEDTGKVLQV